MSLEDLKQDRKQKMEQKKLQGKGIKRENKNVAECLNYN